MILLNDIRGIALLQDWLGTGGKPVGSKRAEWRAASCRLGNNNQPCPENCEPRWWERVKHAIAEVIKHQLELKQQLRLKVAGEDNLHMCRKCGCALPLKVHVPIEHIRKHSDPKMVAALPEWCWMRKELNG